MGKTAGKIIFGLMLIFVAYMLISGEAAIAWERVIIYVMFAVGISVAAEIRAMRQKKQDEEYFSGVSEDSETVQGVVRMPVGLRGIMNFLLVFIWLMIVVCVALAAADGAFSELDSGILGAFGALVSVGIAATVLFTALQNNFLCDIYYTTYEVTVKKGRRDIHYSWNDIGGYKQTNYLYTFQDREGRKLFTTNCSYEGFDGLMAQYRRTHTG